MSASFKKNSMLRIWDLRLLRVSHERFERFFCYVNVLDGMRVLSVFFLHERFESLLHKRDERFFLDERFLHI